MKYCLMLMFVKQIEHFCLKMLVMISHAFNGSLGLITELYT